MDTAITISTSNILQENSTEIKPHNNMLKIGVLALGLVLSSNQMPVNSINITANTFMLSCIDGSFATNGVYSNFTRYNYAERYRLITQAEWFKKAYKNRSLGEIIGIET